MTARLPFGPGMAPVLRVGLVVGDDLQDVAARGVSALLDRLDQLDGRALRTVLLAWAVWAPQSEAGPEGELPAGLAVGRVLLDLARSDDLAPLQEALERLTDGEVRSVALSWLVNGWRLERSPAHPRPLERDGSA